MINLKLFLICSLAFIVNGCKDKDCNGTNTISGRIVNGTTMQGIKGVPLKISIWNVDGNLRAKNIYNIGTVVTDDTGYFKLEYPCQVKQYDEIAIDPLAPYVGYMNAREGYSPYFNKTYYFADKGSVQLVLNPIKPLGTDTLFVGYNEGGTWLYQDSFTNNAPNFWKKIYGKKGGGRGLYWGRGKVKYIKSITNPTQTEWSRVSITGDPVVDSVFANY